MPHDLKPLLCALLAVLTTVMCSAELPAGELVCDDEPVSVFGMSMHKLCIAKHITGFGGYEFDGCTLVVYLTDLSQKEAAEKILAPFFRKYTKSEGECWRGSRTRLEFRQAKYTFMELARWETKLVRDLQVANPDVLSVGRYEGTKIDIFVAYDETIDQVKAYLVKEGLPLDAFRIESKEAELKQVASIAPMVRGSEAMEVEVVLPAVLWSNETVGELVLGRSTLGQVTRLLPAWPGHGPAKPSIPRSKRSPWITAQMHAVLDRMRYTYNPRDTHIVAGFDKKRRLTFVQYIVQEGQETSLIESLNGMTTLTEVFRDDRALVHRGQVGSCVLVETMAGRHGDEKYRLEGVVYLYLCDPEKRR